jgi:Phosphorylase superfamily
MSELKIGIIGGTGLGEILPAASARQQHQPNTPFGSPSDSIIETEWAGIPVFLLSRHGPGHLLPPSQVPYRANIFALKQLGCTHVIASGAVGSLREEFKPGDLVIADQIIDKTNNRPASFYDKAAVHVEFAEPFCPVLRQMFIEAAKKEDGGLKMEDGKNAASESSAPSSILHPPSSPPPPLRYAVLWHQDIDVPHYDLMFETSPGSDLATWRSPLWPITSPTPLQKLRDHRRAFLNYQGQLGGDRGTVTQIAAGTCQIEIDEQSRWIIRLDSNPRQLMLQLLRDDRWQADPLP